MRMTLEIEVTPTEPVMVLREDVEAALRKMLPKLELSWNDPARGRVLGASVEVVDVFPT